MTTHDSGVFSSPAPESEDDERDDLSGMTDEQRSRQAGMDELCSAYADWCRTRGFFGPPPVMPSLLGKLTKKTGRRSSGPPDAACSSQMSALHIAVIAQPADSLDRKVFVLNYLYNVRSVKAASAALGISRQHWYRLLHAFMERVTTTAKVIESHNLSAAEQLQHRGGVVQKAEETDDACEAADAAYRVRTREISDGSI
jgi:hypothetical protein